MIAAVELLHPFQPVANNRAATMRARWRQELNRTFKTIERMFLAVQYDPKALVVMITTRLAR